MRDNTLIGYFCVGICSTLYFYLSTRYSIWNFDDIYHFETYKHNGWGRLKVLFVGADIPNEYRTYSFSRCLQFVLLKLFGNQPFIFYGFMAITHLASGFLIYSIIKGFAKEPTSFSPEGFGCSVIWIFSPFSIVNTFHHFSYLLFPFFLLLVYIFSIESKVKRTFLNNALVTILLVIICVSGEATLPALLTYICIKLYQRARVSFFTVQIIVAWSTLTLHYYILSAVNNYSSRETRFVFGMSNLDAVISNLSYFFASIGSLVFQGIHLTTKSFEPYYPGLPIYSFTWKNLGGSFFFTSLFLFGLLFCTFKIFKEKNIEVKHSRMTMCSSFMSGRTFAMIALFVFSLWGLYLAIAISGAQLYGTQFALQVRYGYVVIPMSLCLLFLTLRKLTNARTIHGLSWAIPCLVVVCWLGSQVVVSPLNAAQNKKIISRLQEAYDRGIRVIRIEHKNFSYSGPELRAFGITNPFIRLGDSPFQQDWTTDSYLGNFLGLTVHRLPLVNRDREYFLTTGAEPILIEKKSVALIGSNSLGVVQVNYPRDDIYIDYELKN